VQRRSTLATFRRSLAYLARQNERETSQFSITKILPAYWRITFNNPPHNLVTRNHSELQGIVGQLESDPELRVVVFDSAHPDFFMARYDISRAAETPVKPGPTGLPAWIGPDCA